MAQIFAAGGMGILIFLGFNLFHLNAFYINVFIHTHTYIYIMYSLCSSHWLPKSPAPAATGFAQTALRYMLGNSRPRQKYGISQPIIIS